MSTSEGLLCFNGYNSVKYSANINEKNTILNDTIISLFISSKNQIWISYINENGFSKYDVETNKFHHYFADSLEKDNSLPPFLSSNIYEDSKGRIWIPTWGSGLFLIDDETGKYIKKYSISTHPDFFVSDYSRYIQELEDDIFLISFFEEKAHPSSLILDFKNDKIYKFDIDRFFPSLSENQKIIFTTALSISHFTYQDKNKDLWIGTYIGLFYLDMQNNIVKRISDPSSDLNIQNLDNTLYYIEDNLGNLWMITPNKGILYVDVQSKKAKYINHQTNNQNSLSDNRIKGISKDMYGNIWISTRLGCFSIYTPFLHQFKIHSWDKMNLSYTNASVQTIPVNQMLVMENGNILLSNSSGISIYDSYLEKEINSFAFNHLIRYLPTNKTNVNNIKMIDNKLYGETGLRIFCYDFITKKSTILSQEKGFQHILFKHDKNMKSIYTVWNEKNASTLYNYNFSSSQFDSVAVLPEEFIMRNRFCHVLDNGKWFMISSEKHFQLFDFESNNHQIFSYKNESTFFPDSTIICSYKDKNDIVYIGTKEGLYSFNFNNNSYEKLNHKIGIDKKAVNSIHRDHNGDLWVAFEKELLKWDENKNKIYLFDRDLGLQSGSFLPSVMQNDSSGNIYIATNNGVLEFHPDKIKYPSIKPEIYLYSISINNDTIVGGDLISFINEDINLDWDQNNLNFTFFNNEVFSPKPHQYLYKLNGIDEKWQNNGSLNTIKLTGLKHGEYELHVKIINSFNLESNLYIVHFKIKKPIWLTVWFYIIIVLTLFFIVFIIIKKREAKLLKNQKKLEDLVKLRTQELESEKELVTKQKEITEQQKDLVEEKQKEIIDSINYAKRIQKAILPSDELINQKLSESFVLYKPKDIVAGDFYWLESYAEPFAKASDSKEGFNGILLAAADCTGHGVPGAMVSVVCHNALNRSVREYGITSPSKILDKTREIIIEEFEKSGEDVKDGMDISLVALQLAHRAENESESVEKTNPRSHTRTHSHSVNWSGANNPLWIIKKDAKEIIEYKANKQPIGKYDVLLPFDNHEIKLETGDSFYLITDGFQDQFGGEKGKKLKAANLKSLLLSISHLNMKEQKNMLDGFFEKWRSNLEQIDDVCIIGVRL